MTEQRSWKRRHGRYMAHVFEQPDGTFSAIGQPIGDTRAAQRDINSLDAAKREADKQVAALWTHSCAREQCGVWEPC